MFSRFLALPYFGCQPHRSDKTSLVFHRENVLPCFLYSCNGGRRLGVCTPKKSCVQIQIWCGCSAWKCLKVGGGSGSNIWCEWRSKWFKQIVRFRCIIDSTLDMQFAISLHWHLRDLFDWGSTHCWTKCLTMDGKMHLPWPRRCSLLQSFLAQRLWGSLW